MSKSETWKLEQAHIWALFLEEIVSTHSINELLPFTGKYIYAINFYSLLLLILLISKNAVLAIKL